MNTGSNIPSDTLLFDIETSPIVSYTWGIWEQNVIGKKEEWGILCASYRWLGEDTVHFIRVKKYGVKNWDKEVVQQLHDLFDKARIVIAHNGDEFDIKKVNARMAFYGMNPPSPFLSVDTKKIAKKHFGFDSNSLDALGEYLGLGRKAKTGGFDLWLACMANDRSAWKKMEEYSVQDVRLLSEVYDVLRPWARTHPVLRNNNPVCVLPNCGGKTHSRGEETTRSGLVYNRYRCSKCGHWSRSNKSLKVNNSNV